MLKPAARFKVSRIVSFGVQYKWIFFLRLVEYPPLDFLSKLNKVWHTTRCAAHED